MARVAKKKTPTKKDWARKVRGKRLKIFLKRHCLMCGKDISFQHGKSLFCGNWRSKTGCSHINHNRYSNLWKKKVRYWARPDRKIKNRPYYMTYYWKTGREKRQKLNAL